MRVPSDMPRPRRQGLGSRGRVGLVLLAVALFILLTSLRGIAGFYTDLLWFDSLGFKSVFTGVLGAKASLTILFSVLFFVLLWVNLFIGDRLAPRFRPAGPSQPSIGCPVSSNVLRPLSTCIHPSPEALEAVTP